MTPFDLFLVVFCLFCFCLFLALKGWLVPLPAEESLWGLTVLQACQMESGKEWTTSYPVYKVQCSAVATENFFHISSLALPSQFPQMLFLWRELCRIRAEVGPRPMIPYSSLYPTLLPGTGLRNSSSEVYDNWSDRTLNSPPCSEDPQAIALQEQGCVIAILLVWANRSHLGPTDSGWGVTPGGDISIGCLDLL